MHLPVWAEVFLALARNVALALRPSLTAPLRATLAIARLRSCGPRTALLLIDGWDCAGARATQAPRIGGCSRTDDRVAFSITDRR